MTDVAPWPMAKFVIFQQKGGGDELPGDARGLQKQQRVDLTVQSGWK